MYRWNCEMVIWHIYRIYLIGNHYVIDVVELISRMNWTDCFQCGALNRPSLSFYFKQMTLATNRPLYEEEWFHGVLPREEVVRLLKSEGDFLVRETIRNEESQIVLSVCWNGHKHFIVQTTADGLYRFEGPAFPSIQELIMHQNLSELPVTSRSGAILKKPVLRERWELSNDDVILLDKIGRVRYGNISIRYHQMIRIQWICPPFSFA